MSKAPQRSTASSSERSKAAPSSRPEGSVAASSVSGFALAGGPMRATAEDPWGPVFKLGDRAIKIGWIIGILLAVGTHGFASARALIALYDLQKATYSMRASIHEFLWTEYDIDLKPEQKDEPEQKKDEPPPPPEPEPDPIPIPAPKAEEPKEDPYDDQKAAPVQAAKILTAPEDPNKIEDLTDQGIVSGDATTGPLGGQSSAEGKSDQITHNPSVSLTGKPGGTGTGDAPPPPPPKKDLSRPASYSGSLSWNCPFPDEADTDQIDFAQVSLIVTVRPDGSPQSVQVVSNPGHGFGRAARMCALSRRYTAGLDRDGNATTMSTPVFRITFSR